MPPPLSRSLRSWPARAEGRRRARGRSLDVVEFGLGRSTFELHHVRLHSVPVDGRVVQSVLVTVASGGLIQTALGVVLGSVLAIAGSRLLASALFGVRPADPVVMLIVGGVLVGSALLATVVPAVRAVLLSPVEALRSG